MAARSVTGKPAVPIHDVSTRHVAPWTRAAGALVRRGAMGSTDPLDVAARLFGAIEAGDVAIVAQLYAPDAVIWHNHTGATQTAAENVQLLGLVTRRLRGLRYEEVRRQRTEHGFVQQHVLRAQGPEGQSVELRACILCDVVDGRITRLYEYLDGAAVARVVSML
jgi:ketosteroid isomerase-like protein